MNGLKLAVDLWRTRFKTVESGMQKSRWVDTADEIKQVSRMLLTKKTILSLIPT